MSRRLTEPIPPRPTAGHAPAVAVVALGANLGHRAETLDAALRAIAKLPLVDEVVASEAMETVALKPEGPDDTAPAYLNAVALVTTRLAPTVLLDYLQDIETRYGRVREVRWGDRTLDLDLISYADVQSDAADLTLPHPRAAERDFVLAPWLSIDPDAVLPGRGRVDELLARIRESS